MAKTPDIKAQRRVNLRMLVDGGDISREELANRCGWASPSFVSQMLSGYRVISDKTARRVEDAAGKPRYWMDQPHSSTAPMRNVETDPSFIGGAVQAVAEIQQDLKAAITPEKYAEIVDLVYDRARRDGSVDRDFARRLIKLTM